MPRSDIDRIREKIRLYQYDMSAHAMEEMAEEWSMKSLNLRSRNMYGYRCEYCEGTVHPRTVKQEAFKHRDGFVILENVAIQQS